MKPAKVAHGAARSENRRTKNSISAATFGGLGPPGDITILSATDGAIDIAALHRDLDIDSTVRADGDPDVGQVDLVPCAVIEQASKDASASRAAAIITCRLAG